MLRGILIFLGLATILVVLLVTVQVRIQPRASAGWQEFSIGPATGNNLSVNSSALRGEGVTLRSVLEVAYGMPRTRIFGPDWLSQDRFAITAAVALEGPDQLGTMLKQELANRVGLTAHVEEREFEVFVLSAKQSQSLTRAAERNTNIQVRERDLRARNTTLAQLADVLQNQLGKPVVDETNIPGWFDVDLAWGEDRERTIAEALETRAGLKLTKGRRKLSAVIVDRADRGATLAMISRMGGLSGWMPMSWRRQVSNAFSIH